MKTDIQGCSTCPKGAEQYEHYHDAIFCIHGGEKKKCNCKEGQRIQYDFRTTGGVLFATVSTDLETARIKRDNWLKERKLEK